MRTTFIIIALAALNFSCGGCDDSSVQGSDAGSGTDAGCVGNCADVSTGSVDMGGTIEDMSSDAGSCPAALACGTTCCATGELCIADSCVIPGDPCESNLDCADGDVCEPTIGKCIPDPGVDCTYQPDFSEFDPVVNTAWRAEDTTPESSYNQVMMTPSVADLNEDGIPDVVFSTFTGSAYNAESVLRAFDGRTFQPIFDLTELDKRVSGSGSIAIGDIDNDLRNEIIAVAPGAQGLIAFDDHTTGWSVLWTSEAFPFAWDGAYLTDLDGNGTVEVVAGVRVLDGATGNVLCANLDAGQGPLNASAADLDGDGDLEVVSGQIAFQFVDNQDGTFSCPTYWTPASGGFPAVADFGTFDANQNTFGVPDGKPEIVTVNTAAADQIQLLNGQTGERIWSATLPTTGHPYFSDVQCSERTGAGPPTVADFDGDGQPEIATAGACYYVVYETDGTLLWKHPSQDFSSRVTGSSVFDFQGDGKAEVVYADECFIRVYDGSGNGDGTTEVLFKRTHTSGTTRELPVVVDVDRDFHAEIVMISNDYSQGTSDRCSATWPDFDMLGGPERGILVVDDPNNEWVTTRPIWNQHAYHVTNVCDGIDDNLCPGAAQNVAGVIPPVQTANWTQSFLNNFRQNVQGEGLFDAPDLVVSDIDHSCEANGITIAVTVANQGARGIVAGTPVTIWFTLAGTEQLVTTLFTTVDLPPGGRETLTFDWTNAPNVSATDTFQIRAVVDDDGMGASLHNECVEDNNALIFDGMCRCVTDANCDIDEFCSDGTCVPIPM